MVSNVVSFDPVLGCVHYLAGVVGVHQADRVVAAQELGHLRRRLIQRIGQRRPAHAAGLGWVLGQVLERVGLVAARRVDLKGLGARIKGHAAELRIGRLELL